MAELYNSFISKSFLRSVWALEFEAFKGSTAETSLLSRLKTWAVRKDLTHGRLVRLAQKILDRCIFIFFCEDTVTDNMDGKRLANALRKLAVPDNPEAAKQVIALESELSILEADIAAKEAAINSVVDDLYGLQPNDRAVVSEQH